MTFHILTLFPDMITEGCNHSILGRAIKSGQIKINPVNIRDFSNNKHGQIDDAPYGGGAGMVIMAPPVFDTFEFIKKDLPTDTPCIYLSPQGKTLNQPIAEGLKVHEHIILLCGHYEGIDERVLEEIVTMEISIGDFILSGGELAALVLIDAVSRLRPGVLGNKESNINESFSGEYKKLLEHPHYTRPPLFRGKPVPDVLLSGNHGEIAKWRYNESVKRTLIKRPDL